MKKTMLTLITGILLPIETIFTNLRQLGRINYDNRIHYLHGFNCHSYIPQERD